jgi:hypothetical protein
VRSNHLSYRPHALPEQTEIGRGRREPAQAYTFFVKKVFPVMKGHEDGG